jgi:predicted nucleotidyltransferase
MFGISDKSLGMIRSVLEDFPNVEQGIIFGSRAMKNHKTGSDVDIAIQGDEVDWETTSKISGKLNESLPLPYFFDVVDYTHLDNPELKEHIKKYGIVFYQKNLNA